MKKILNRWAVLAVAAAAVGFAGAAMADDLPVINLTIHKAQFEPTQLKVPAGKRFKLKVTNKGPGIEEFESIDLNREQIVPPGSTIQVYVGPLQPGRYKVFGDFHPDTAKAELIAE